MNSSTLNIAIEIDDKGSVKLRELGQTAKKAGDDGVKSFSGMRDSVNQMKGSTDLSIKSLMKMGGISFAGTLAGVTALTTGVVTLVNNSGQLAREMDNSARLAGENSKRFQEYAFVTSQFNVDYEERGEISKDTHEKLGEFIKTGGGGFKDFFDLIAPKVGITAQELQHLSGPDVLIRVKDAMDQLGISEEEQVSYLEDIASNSYRLAPLLKDNGAALKEQADRADELGIALSSVDSQRLIEAQQKTLEVQAAMGGLKNHIAATLAPVVTDLGDKLLNAMADGGGGVDDLAVTISDKLLVALGYGVEAIRFFHNGWLGIKLVGTAAIDAIAQSVDFLYGGLRLLLKPLDMAMDGLVTLGAIDANPFDGMENALDTFSASSRDVTNQVLDDISKTNAGYDSVKATIDQYRQSVIASGNDSTDSATKQIAALQTIADHAATAANQRVEVEKLTASQIKAIGEETLDFWKVQHDDRYEIKSRALEAEISLEKQSITSIDDELTTFYDDVTAMSEEKTTAMSGYFADFGNSVQSTAGRELGGYLVEQFGGIESAWGRTFDSMVVKLTDVLAEMAAKWAASKIGQSFEGWDIFHSGLWSLEDEEVPAIIKRKEMVIPEKQAEEIRNRFNGFNGDWDGLVDAFGQPDAGSWAGEFSSELGREYAKDLAAVAVGMVASIDPASQISGVLGIDNAVSNTSNSLSTVGTSAMGLHGVYSDVGGWLGKAASIIGLSGTAASPFSSGLGSFLGGWVGDMVGDALNDREFEALRDALESGLITPTEALSFQREAERVGMVDGSTLGGIIGAVKDVFGDIAESISSVISSKSMIEEIDEELEDFFSDLDDGSYNSNNDTDYGDGSGWGDSDSGDGSGIGDTGGGTPDHEPGGQFGMASGGVVNRLYVPSGDDGYMALKFGEGVVKADTMDILDSQIRSGAFGSAQVESEIRNMRKEITSANLKIISLLRNQEKLMQRWNKVGLQTVAVA